MKFHRNISFWLVLLIAAGVLFFVFKKTFNSIEVKTYVAAPQMLELTVSATATGTIKSDREVKVTAERQGRVSRLLHEEGDFVKSNALIAELDPEEASLNLKMAEASYEKAKAVLEGIKTALEPFSIDVETAIQSSSANLKEAEKKLNRFRELKDKGLISEAELDSAERDYNVLKASYEASLSGRKTLLSKAQEIKAQSLALKEAESALSLARLNYRYSFIKAPISGVISSMPVKVGEALMKGGLLATLISTEAFYIEAFIDEADIGKVKIGQDVRVSIDAYPEKTFMAKVYKISPVVLGGKQETRTFEVRTRLKGTMGVSIKPGMSADIEIIVGKLSNALVLPSQAVMERNKAKYVFLKDGVRARLKKIETGLYNWTYTEIISGIKEGDEVVVNPDSAGLKDGVRIKSSGLDN